MDLKHGEKYKSIGIKIAKYRKERHMTQEELANGVGVSYVKKMSLEVLFDIADCLKIDIKDLL